MTVWEQGGVPNDPELYDHFGAYHPSTGPETPTGGTVNPREDQIYKEAFTLNAQGDGLGDVA